MHDRIFSHSSPKPITSKEKQRQDSPCSPKRWRSWTPQANGGTNRNSIASKAHSCCNSIETIKLKPSAASITPLRSLATNKPSPSSYAPPPVWLDSGSSKANARKPMTSLHQSTGGLRKALTHRICRRRKRCWKRWRNTRLAGTLHNPLSVKHFHAVWAGNVHECSLKSCIGKASLYPLGSVAESSFCNIETWRQ